MLDKFKLACASTNTKVPWIQDEKFDNIHTLPDKIVFLSSQVRLEIKDKLKRSSVWR